MTLLTCHKSRTWKSQKLQVKVSNRKVTKMMFTTALLMRSRSSKCTEVLNLTLKREAQIGVQKLRLKTYHQQSVLWLTIWFRATSTSTPVRSCSSTRKITWSVRALLERSTLLLTRAQVDFLPWSASSYQTKLIQSSVTRSWSRLKMRSAYFRISSIQTSLSSTVFSTMAITKLTSCLRWFQEGAYDKFSTDLGRSMRA